MLIQSTSSDGTGLAFTRADVDSRGRGLFFSASSGGPNVDRSVRAFDGAVFETLWPDGIGGVHNRHNGALLYVPIRDELWIWGGSHMETIPNALRSGRFHVDTKKWLATSLSDSGAFAGIIKGTMPFRANMALAWSKDANTGMLFGGSDNAIYDDCYLIEPNLAGPEPYKLTLVIGPRPLSRTQAQNLLVAVGPDFYLCGGYYGQVPEGYLFRQDLWKFSRAAQSWTKLASPPADAYAANLATDGQRLLFWVDNKIYLYDIATDKWDSGTPAPFFSNGVGVYLPITKSFYFQGGNEANGASNYAGYSVTLDASTPPPTGFNIPNRTWVARAYKTPNTPGYGGGSKHLRLEQNLDNGRIYICGGDWTSSPGDGSFQNGLYSYSIPEDEMRVEYPYCGLPGEIMPGRPDEVGWIWDTKRKLFWMLPGFLGLAQSGPGVCGAGPNVATQVQEILTFDPVTKKWSRPGVPPEPIEPGIEKPKNAVYDSQTDSIYRVYYHGGMGIVWDVLNITTKQWSSFQTPHADDGTYINDAHLNAEYLAGDVANRHIYVIDPNYYRLLRLHMDTHAVTIMAPIPEVDSGRPGSLQDITIPVFDTVNNVLLYLYIRSLAGINPKLLIFHPNTNKWEVDPMTQPDGLPVRGGSAAFDRVNNVLMIIGGLQVGGENDPTLTHFFIYRYAKPEGEQTVDVKQGVKFPAKTVPGSGVVVAKHRVSLLDSSNTEVEGKDVTVGTPDLTFSTVPAGNGYKFRYQTLDAAGTALDESFGPAFNVVATTTSITIVVADGVPVVS